MTVKVGIINVTGYAGMELARILRHHLDAQLVAVTGRSMAGKRLDSVFPHLVKMGLPIIEKDELEGVDVAFSALPHKASAEACIQSLEKGAKVVDISADFRLKDVHEYESWYKVTHPGPQYLEEAVYGLTELHRREIASARLVANPGCYPTGALLGLAPLVKERLIGPDVIIDAKSGVSGAGRTLSLNVHFSEADENVSAYGLEGHRHLPEITQELRQMDTSQPWQVTFVPHLIPMTRGILSTIYVKPADSRLPISAQGQKRLTDLFRDYYKNEPFLDVTQEPPQTKQTWGSNMTQVYPVMDLRTGRIMVITTLDNLVKGAAGQAIQNMNLMFGLPETEGLDTLAFYP
ncbi:MAG: N-acetyl-gamma-glutamyl-phosphate reductase [Chloroflexi bacterium]|nr:N-acetyl-gamma-glutamyl-phosphate reductase [Chloroflexota bacterium]